MSAMNATTTHPPLPPFTRENATQKVRLAEDGWNSRDPEDVVLAYTVDNWWAIRAEFAQGRFATLRRPALIEFLTRRWRKELDFRLIEELWAFDGSRIAVRFAYEWHDDSGNWFRSYGNENWDFAEKRTDASSACLHQRCADQRIRPQVSLAAGSSPRWASRIERSRSLTAMRSIMQSRLEAQKTSPAAYHSMIGLDYAVEGTLFCKADKIPPDVWTTHATGATRDEAQRIVLAQASRLVAKSRMASKFRRRAGAA